MLRRGVLGHVVITGGSSGIGLAAAELFARCGFALSLIARSDEKLARAAEHLSELVNADAPVATFSTDVADAEAVSSAFTTAAERWGAPHIVIHAAGYAYPDYFPDIPDSEFRTTLSTNIVGTWNVMRTAVRVMADQPPTDGPAGNGTKAVAADAPTRRLVRRMADGWRFLCPVSSLAGVIPAFGYSAYGMSKFGIVGLALTLRQELWARRISVSVLCPPDVDTPQLLQEAATKPPETHALSAGTAPLSPGFVAAELAKYLPERRAVIIPGASARMDYFLYRLVPRIAERVIMNRIRKVKNHQ